MPHTTTRTNTRTRTALALAAASTLAAVAPLAQADVTGGTGQEFLIQTTGATALKAFSSADGNRGTYLLGQPSLVIGGSTYTLPSGAIAQPLGRQNRNSAPSFEPPLTADRLVYGYHETGSGNGIRDLAIRNGILVGSTVADAPTISSSNPHFVMGEEHVNFPIGTLSNGYQSYYNSTPNQQAVPGVSGAFYDYTNAVKPLPQVAYSDVSFEQFFAVAGDARFDAAPTDAGYGQGQAASQYSTRFNADSPNFQDLTPDDILEGGVNPATTQLRNTALAAVPFTISANPGTGLDSISEADARFLQAAGRLENGANFHSVTRDVGSGTRNQGSNNLNLDPSFGAGERDRVQLVDQTTGDLVVGDEANPRQNRLSADGTFDGNVQANTNEYGPSAIAAFADKRSGSSALRPTVLQQRMALGVLSVGDVGSRGRANGSGATNPLRVLAIDFEGDDFVGTGEPGAVQPTADDVTSGRYQLWSAAQAVTVRGTLATGGDANGQLSGGVAQSATVNGSLDAGGTILNDVDDDGSGTGIVKKFLQNVTGDASLTNFAAGGVDVDSTLTPLDTIIAAGFIPLPLMDVTKTFDGGTQTTNTRTADADAIYAGSAGDAIRDALDFDRAGSLNGTIGAQVYRIYDVDNTSNKKDAPQGNVEIPFSARIFLAGDLNGDGVRDLEDTEAWADAVSDTDGFLAINPDIDIDSSRSVTINAGVGGTLDTSELDTAANREQRYALLALSDLNGDGNVEVVGDFGARGTDAPDRLETISREDVRFFLYGASVDTLGAGFTSAQDRRELGVRLGQLKKNEAIARFNDRIDSNQGDASLKFDPFDVNHDDLSNLQDARIVDRNIGADYTSLADVIATGDDLIAAELNDDNVITFISSDGLDDGDKSDFELIYDDLVDSNELVPGDFNLNGTVNLADFGILRANFGAADGVDGYEARYTTGDATLNGAVNLADFGVLRANFGQSAGSSLLVAGEEAAMDLEVVVNWATGEVTLVGEGTIAGLELTSTSGSLAAGGLADTGLDTLIDTDGMIAIGTMSGGLFVDGELSLGTIFDRFGAWDVNSLFAGTRGTMVDSSITYIPEPATAGVLLGAAGVLLRRRRA
jgi:hypothetical protein